MKPPIVILLCMGALAACTSDPDVDVGVDAGADAGTLPGSDFTAGGPASETVLETEATQEGLVLVGGFAETARFGALTLTSAGDTDGYVAHHRSDGSAIWAKAFGGTGRDQLRAVAVAPTGHVLVAGVFEGTVAFDATRPGTTLTSEGPIDGFVAALSPSGGLLWARRFGGLGFDDPRGLAVDDDGSILIGGAFTERITLGPGEANETSLHGEGSVETAFVAKLDAEGGLVWARVIGGASAARIQDLSFLRQGAVLVAGSFLGDCVLGRGETITATLSTGLADDGFVARYSASGDFVSAYQVGSRDGYDAIQAVLPRDDGYDLAGDFSGSIEVGGVSLTAVDRLDAFVARIGADDRARWARSIGGADFDTATAIAPGPADGLLVVGHVRGSQVVTFSKGGLGELTSTPPGGGDALYARFSADGALLAAALIGSTGSETAKGVYDPASPKVIGEYEGTLPRPGGGTFTAVGGFDIFAVEPE